MGDCADPPETRTRGSARLRAPVKEPRNTVEALVRGVSDQGLLVRGRDLNPRPSGYEPESGVSPDLEKQA